MRLADCPDSSHRDSVARPVPTELIKDTAPTCNSQRKPERRTPTKDGSETVRNQTWPHTWVNSVRLGHASLILGKSFLGLGQLGPPVERLQSEYPIFSRRL